MDTLKPFFVVSRFKEDPSWIKEYTNNYIIYNKGEELDESFNVKVMPNIGANQYDIFHFIYHNYEDLPDLTAFVQGEPWDHCNREKFDKIIHNEFFTALESFEHVDTSPGSGMRLDNQGGYMEINNSWYIVSHNSTHGITCQYPSYHNFMNEMFKDYENPPYVRFTPGSQYLVPKENVLRYSKKFWKFIMNKFPETPLPTEGHIIERSLYYIFTGKYKEQEFF
jgi:hypothetical protein